MSAINNYIEHLKPYKIASQKIWEDNVFNRDVYKLDWNEATIPPSPEVLSRLENLILNQQFFSYYPNTNNKALTALLASYLNLEVGFFECFSGSDIVHEHIVRLILTKGDSVFILGPTYDNFRVTCETQGAKISIYEPDLDLGFMDFDLIDKIKSENPKIVYLCNPNNPTGRFIQINEIKALVSAFPEVLFVVDEAYYEFSKESCINLVTCMQNLMVTRTFSKAFALANFRFGYVCSNEKLIENIRKLKNYKNISTFTQEAVIGALSDTKYMWDYVDQVIEARSFLKAELEKLEYVNKVFDSRGNFLLVELTSGDIKELLINFLERNLIYVRNVSHSSKLINSIRITVGTMSQMIYVVNQFKNFNDNSGF